ncbi:MAG TPA: DUF4185 domain-containing protein [Bryobacteraceae bacterium]|jgi:hypothetical protein|nr:DUF4185 domain-containing protein [Bryobacteraceae bacterium]
MLKLFVALFLLFAAGGESNFFPYAHGWLGADAAYSIPLDRTSTVWLFGDTFIGARREPSTMIHNSIALRRCHKDGCQVTYWWSGMHTQHGSSFFQTPESDYYWPLDGFVYRNNLYVFLEQMHTTGDGGAFGFDYSGITLATVANFSASPAKWKVSYRTISTGNPVVPGIAAVIPAEQSAAGYLYTFTLFRKSAPEPFAGLMRVPLADLAGMDRLPHWQYLAEGSQWLAWKRSTSPANALQLLKGNITEMSVAFHAARQRWIAVYPTPGFLSNTASYSTAGKLTGPWKESRTLFRYPEMQKEDPRYTPRVFCYAAKEHPELETDSRLAITYACNSTTEQEILRDMRLYHPELVVLGL